jgi:hypothetical protein
VEKMNVVAKVKCKFRDNVERTASSYVIIGRVSDSLTAKLRHIGD